jgi:histidinol-phosphate aminotransferase
MGTRQAKLLSLDGYVRPAIRRLAGYVPGEQPADRKYIKLNTNENPYPPSPRVLAAIRAAANEDLRLYPDPMADVLRDKAAELYGFSRDQILAGNGSDDLLAMIIRTCVDPSDRVVYPHPTYSLYDVLVMIGGGDAVHVPFPDDYTLPEGLAEAGGRVTFLCNPNSPSATAVPIEEIEALSRKVSGLLVVDEAYVDFARESALALARRADNVVVLRTFSKSFSLAGMRVGLAFGPREFIGELAKVKDSYNVTRLSMTAAVAALDDYAWMETNVERIRATRRRLSRELRNMGFAVLPSEANFVFARRPGRNVKALYEGLKSRGILVRHFDVPELEDGLRITVGTDEEVDRLLAALHEVLSAEY